jgi:cytochrome c-type biogenesis protein CcmH
MLFWLFFALMTGVAMFSVLWPLSRTRHMTTGARLADLAVYRDQLKEIEHDRASGLIPQPEAEAARVEVARRLISVADETADGILAAGALGRRRAAAVIAFFGMPLIATALYLALSTPEQLGAQSSTRTEKPVGQQEINQMISRVEAHLIEQPNDGRGWELLAPIYLRFGRTAEAVRARTNALRLLGSNSDREADLGEALVAKANGVVITEARNAFERALSADSKNVKARFFLGLAAEQGGRKNEAIAIWRELAADAPAGARWLPSVLAALARIEGAK